MNKRSGATWPIAEGDGEIWDNNGCPVVLCFMSSGQHAVFRGIGHQRDVPYFQLYGYRVNELMGKE